MKNPTDQGFEQHDNVQAAVDQESLLIVGHALSNHPNDTHDAEPTLDAIPPALGTPDAAALDTGYCGPATLEACARRGIEPYIAPGREPHHQSWQERFAPLPAAPHGVRGRLVQCRGIVSSVGDDFLPGLAGQLFHPAAEVVAAAAPVDLVLDGPGQGPSRGVVHRLGEQLEGDQGERIAGAGLLSVQVAAHHRRRELALTDGQEALQVVTILTGGRQTVQEQVVDVLPVDLAAHKQDAQHLHQE